MGSCVLDVSAHFYSCWVLFEVDSVTAFSAVVESVGAKCSPPCTLGAAPISGTLAPDSGIADCKVLSDHSRTRARFGGTRPCMHMCESCFAVNTSVRCRAPGCQGWEHMLFLASTWHPVASQRRPSWSNRTPDALPSSCLHPGSWFARHRMYILIS